jgi:hypothetical protein
VLVSYNTESLPDSHAYVPTKNEYGGFYPYHYPSGHPEADFMKIASRTIKFKLLRCSPIYPRLLQLAHQAKYDGKRGASKGLAYPEIQFVYVLINKV